MFLLNFIVMNMTMKIRDLTGVYMKMEEWDHEIYRSIHVFSIIVKISIIFPQFFKIAI